MLSPYFWKLQLLFSLHFCCCRSHPPAQAIIYYKGHIRQPSLIWPTLNVFDYNPHYDVCAHLADGSWGSAHLQGARLGKDCTVLDYTQYFLGVTDTHVHRGRDCTQLKWWDQW